MNIFFLLKIQCIAFNNSSFSIYHQLKSGDAVIYDSVQYCLKMNYNRQINIK